MELMGRLLEQGCPGNVGGLVVFIAWKHPFQMKKPPKNMINWKISWNDLFCVAGIWFMPEKRLGFAICCYSALHSRCGRPACDAGAASPAEISPFPGVHDGKKEKNMTNKTSWLFNIAMENP